MKRGEMLERMLSICINAHRGQLDRGAMPYIFHPLKVMHYLETDDEELQCIALGHDLVEDTDCNYEELLQEGMSVRVVNAIKCLTKQPNQSLDDYKRQVFSNKDAMLVKLQDLRHNSDIRRLKKVTDKDVARIAKYDAFTQEILTQLKEIS
jgi:(p)ppGpp synthase/HD superfamily hydrolase